MNVRSAVLSGKEYEGAAAAAMWQAIEGHGFDYFVAAFSARGGGLYDVDVGILGVACHFTLDFPNAESLQRFFNSAIHKFATERDDAECLAAYRRIGAAAGLSYCAKALEAKEGRELGDMFANSLPTDIPTPKPIGEES